MCGFVHLQLLDESALCVLDAVALVHDQVLPLVVHDALPVVHGDLVGRDHDLLDLHTLLYHMLPVDLVSETRPVILAAVVEHYRDLKQEHDDQGL